MPPLIFLDANIAIYAAGRPHPLKEPCTRILSAVSVQPNAFISDVEVIQELMHRYLAQRNWDAGRGVAEMFLELMRDRLEPVLQVDMEQAMQLADLHPDGGARDLLHVAVMQRLGVTRIASADRGLDRIQGIERLDPAVTDEWLGMIEPGR